MNNIALQLTHINKHFGHFQALKDVNFTLHSGEVHCLVGENGCGKSTLIKIISGVYTPDAGGYIQIGGSALLRKMTPQQAQQMGIAVIWQDLALFPTLTVAENICFDQFVHKPLHKPSREIMHQKAKDVMDRLGISLNLYATVESLSIAERQLVAIARVLASNARIIFMDEPTASLTHSEVMYLLKAVEKMKQDGMSIVFVSHRLAEVLSIADKVTVIRDGSIIEVLDAKTTNDKALSRLMTGLDLTDNVRSREQNDEVVLDVRNVTRMGEFHDVSFQLHKGEILGITGLLGAGRTELALSLFGMKRFDKGEILLDGKRLSCKSNQDAIKAGIAYVSEDRLRLGLIQVQSIEANSVITVLDKLTRFIWYLSPKNMAKTTAHWLNKLHVKHHDTQLPIHSLSGGNQQRVAIAKWLETNPKVLILDAPTVGVDVGAKAEIFKVVSELADKGLSIIVISDEVNEVFYQCDRVLVMQKGTITNECFPQYSSEQQLEEIVYGVI